MSPPDARADRRAAHAESILRAAIAAADPAAHVRAAIAANPSCRSGHTVRLLAIGKAAAAMSAAALDALPAAPREALVIVPHDTEAAPGPGLRTMHAAHPIPDHTSVAAGRAAAALLAGAGVDDIVLALISGGASSLCALPADGIDIDEYAGLVRALLHAGADIRELNTVRTHIDVLKGGGMARLAAPARVVCLVISDVVHSPLDIIASGPFSPPATAPADAVRVLEKYGLHGTSAEDRAHAVALGGLDAGLRGTTSAGTWDHVTVRVILDNRSAIDGAARAAVQLGYRVHIEDEPLVGAARAAAAHIVARAVRVAETIGPADAPVCMLWGGETTVVVSGGGTGGRNQELVLAAALALRAVPRITIGSIATDGVDGPTDAAGAIADGRTCERGAHAGRDAALSLEHNDSWTFFAHAGGLIHTGPTGTNVMDVQIAVVDPPQS
ncbi:MAG TPA: DUF4147 domain-containing protein [Longimicrobiales bacterium]